LRLSQTAKATSSANPPVSEGWKIGQFIWVMGREANAMGRKYRVDHYRIVKGVFRTATNGQLAFATII
jgi:hypothetical protein